MLRIIITALTVLYLAFAAQTALSYLVTSRDPGYSSIVLETENTNGGSSNSRLLLKALFTDGLLRRNVTDRAAGALDAKPKSDYVLDGQDSKTPVLTFQANRFLAVLQPIQWSGIIRVKRDGRTVQVMDMRSWTEQPRVIAVEDPVAPRSGAVLAGSLILFGACAWWFGPLSANRKSILWLVFFLASLHLLYWASHPVGTTEDSDGYLNTVPQVFFAGVPAYYPPGYPALLGLLGTFAGGRLGTLVTLIQHAMVVLAAVWFYRLFRDIISEELAIFAALMAGVVNPALTVPQSVLSETPTYFAMVGALYYAVRGAQTGRALFMVISGILIGWAGTLRIVPLIAVLPAVGFVYLSSHLRHGLRRLGMTATAALAILLLPVLWCWHKSGRPTLTSSVGFHVFDRAVLEEKLLDEDGPATRKLLLLLSGKDPRDFSEHRDVREHSGLSGLDWDQKELLFRNVSREGIYKDIWKFLVYTPYLAWRMFLAPTGWIPTWADTIAGSPLLESPAPLAFTASGLAWSWALEQTLAVLWPILCWAAIAGTLAGLLSGQRLLILAAAWVPTGYLLSSALVEYFSPRYNAAVVPFVAVLAVLPFALVQTTVKQSWGKWATHIIHISKRGSEPAIKTKEVPGDV